MALMADVIVMLFATAGNAVQILFTCPWDCDSLVSVEFLTFT